MLDEEPLPPQLALSLLQEVKKCFHDIPGGRTPNQVEFLSASTPVRLQKPNIYECDLFRQCIRQQLPLFEDLFERQLGPLVEVLRDRIACCEDLVQFDTASGASRAVTLKLQMNEGGAFPWHYDNPGLPNKRRLTMAVYLTEDWVEGMGGELQLMPFLGKCLSVKPKLNTIVLFRSDLILHRVAPLMPTADGRRRYCFTVWFDGLNTNASEDLLLTTNHLHETAIPLLKHSPIQRTLSRAVYSEEYKAALMDCFGEESAGNEVSLKEHNAHVLQLQNNPKVRPFLLLLREYRDAALAA